MNLTESVTAAVADADHPAAVLALQYADAIDQAVHTPVAFAEALAALNTASALADTVNESTEASRALRKVTAALATATILEHLGPKLLTTLDTLLITPRAKAAVTRGVVDAARPVSPLDALRERHDSRRLRAVE